MHILCGIACSNPVPPGRVVACLAISECNSIPHRSPRNALTRFLGGAWFADREEEQKRLLEVLRLVEREDAWPGASAEQALRAQWKQV